jgi:gliding motility-associated protein GldM
MALPKEPRQKMINMMYLVLTALLALNVSSEILNAFKTINTSMESTNTTVKASSANILTSLEALTKDPAKGEKATFWYGKATQAKDLSDAAFNYLQDLKAKIVKEAGGDINKPEVKFKEDNLDIATRMLAEGKGGKDLENMLAKYRTDILHIDPKIDTSLQFGKAMPVDLTIPKTTSKAGKTWQGAYFHMVPTVAAITILTKFQNDIRSTENKVVSTCHEQVGKVEIVFDAFEAIVGQNSNYLMPGQELEIRAGLGAFSTKKLPEITINGSRVATDEHGLAVTKIPAGANGQHKIPVVVSFIDQDGKPQTKTVDVEYTVGQSNASIALDKMNVLYIGVDNPVTIAASGGGDDKVTASITSGSLIKVGPGKYVAKVTQQNDDTRITVTVDGKTAGVSSFRVRNIPGSVATVGGFASGETIPAATFKAQGGVAAWIKDFPFDLKYVVTQFTISTDSDDGDIVEAPTQGNAFTGKAADILRTHVKRGKTVYIDNIRAMGPDGQNKKVPSLVYYIN